MTDFLKDPPKRFKTLPTRGGEPKVSRDGGMYGHGLIRDVSVITRGEALGHDMWADETFLSQVAAAMNSQPKGIKSRLTHPSLSADGTGKFLGRLKGARVDGNQVKSDQHLSRAATRSPDGDLAGYVMDLAEEDPEAFGLSIVFEFDMGEMNRFRDKHMTADGAFLSPDPDNLNNLPHVRLHKLHAADVVDDPAANPDGLFHRDQQIAVEADALLAYAAGLNDEKPAVSAFNVDGDRLKQFFQRFCESHNVKLEQSDMKTKIKFSGEPQDVPAEETPAEDNPAVDAATEPVQDTSEADTPADEPTEQPAGDTEPGQQLSAGQRFLDAFGDQGGVWFAQGKSFEECQVLYTQQLRAENEALKKKLSTRRDDSEESAVKFENGEKNQKKQGFASKIKVK